MEDVVTKLYPHMLDIKSDLLENGAKISLVSGSGASVFGIFMNDYDLNLATKNMKDKYSFVKKVELI